MSEPKKIPRRIQRRVRKACVATYNQGRLSRFPGMVGCEYTARVDVAVLHCAVGHALTPEMRQVGLSGSVRQICLVNDKIREHLGIAPWVPIEMADKYTDSALELWTKLQKAHDQANQNQFKKTFWNGAQAACKAAGFDLGNPPKEPKPKIPPPRYPMSKVWAFKKAAVALMDHQKHLVKHTVLNGGAAGLCLALSEITDMGTYAYSMMGTLLGTDRARGGLFAAGSIEPSGVFGPDRHQFLALICSMSVRDLFVTLNGIPRDPS